MQLVNSKQKPLSHQTVARSVEELGDYVEEKVKYQIEHFQYFALALDESTDIRAII